MRLSPHTRLILCCVLLIGTGASVSWAQAAPDTHHDALLSTLIQCVNVPVEAWVEARERGDGVGIEAASSPELAIDWSGALPFMEASVSAHLLDGGIPLSKGTAGGQLRIDVDEGRLEYVRAPRRAAEPLERRIRIGLRYTLTEPGGGIVASDSCVETRSDLHTIQHARSLADPRWNVTDPVIPQTGFWHRYLQPTVLVAATAVGTYLFFNLRSDRADGN